MGMKPKFRIVERGDNLFAAQIKYLFVWNNIRVFAKEEDAINYVNDLIVDIAKRKRDKMLQEQVKRIVRINYD